MGRHEPMGWGHRRRFVIALAGIAALAFAALAIVALIYQK
jgi:hypothetical protein